MYIDYLNLLAQYKRVDLDTVAKEVVVALQSGDIEPYAVTLIIVDEYQYTDLIQYLWALSHKYTTNGGLFIYCAPERITRAILPSP